ncbi:hypothetical protein C8Q79DRAFT_1106951 [Trametes meyenii]|nr:hypothetical protein C8Q79DRAFT_1106951 [Trametes meyenii]
MSPGSNTHIVGLPQCRKCRSLTTELWRMVGFYLTREDQRTCLLVSNSMRHIVRPLLFSRVILKYGIWLWDEDIPFLEDDVPIIEDRMRVNHEILSQVCSDASFAKLVKKIDIQAHHSQLTSDECPEDIDLLLAAIEALPDLRSFRWYGKYPQLGPPVFQALVKAAATSLTELDFPVLSADCAAYLASFKSLHTLSLGAETLCQLPLLRGRAGVTVMQSYLEQAPRTLVSLSVQGDALWNAPVDLLSNIRELYLADPSTLNGLHLVFQNCSQLRGFGMLIGSQTKVSLHSVLEENRHALPHLTSFKLLYYGRTGLNESNSLFTFLRDKMQLRRLDIKFSEATASFHTALLDLIGGLTKLEVVGLQVVNFQRVYKQLPPGLTALLLHPSMAELEDNPQATWTELLVKLRSLRYLHVLGSYESIGVRDAVAKDSCPSLELLGTGPELSWTQRDANSELAFSKAWNYWTVAMRTIDDFGCADWEWLLRGHDYEGLAEWAYDGLL